MLNKIYLPSFYTMPLAILLTHIHVQDKTLELLGKRRISDNWNSRNA